MNTTKRRFVLASIVGLSLLATVCSDDEEKGTDTTEAPATTQAGGGAETTAAPETTEAAEELSGEIAIDGSSTVAPLMKLTGEDFMDANSGVNVVIGTSGTGGGFEKFCVGETDISNASRPIKDEEVTACGDNGIEFIEVLVANDALSVVVNPDNDWAECLTIEQLNLMWAPEAEDAITNWNQIDPSFPDQALTLFGAGTDSGTFDYFTKEVNGEEGASRTDYNATEDDNTTVTGVNGDVGALGYFGFSYLLENEGTVKGVAIDSGEGCVEPSADNVQSGSYTPLARPLYIYISTEAASRPEVQGFVQYYVDNQDALAEEALYIPLDDTQKGEQAGSLATVLAG